MSEIIHDTLIILLKSSDKDEVHFCKRLGLRVVDGTRGIGMSLIASSFPHTKILVLYF